MDKKKTIIISVICIIILFSIIALVWISLSNDDTKIIESANSKTTKLYNSLKDATSYSFTATLDDNNKIEYAKKDNMAFLKRIYKGDESKYIIKDGNTYLILDEDKAYYTYQNNETDLNMIEFEINNIKDLECTQGSEKIENKKYTYEEFKKATNLTFKNMQEVDEGNVKTRFYYKGDNLVYIKNISENGEELIKVDMSYNNNNDNLFEIPSDYEER